jgi:hypothetical protein
LQEDNENFVKYSQGVEINWEAIKAKIRADKDREEKAAQ